MIVTEDDAALPIEWGGEKGDALEHVLEMTEGLMPGAGVSAPPGRFPVGAVLRQAQAGGGGNTRQRKSTAAAFSARSR